MFTIVVLSCALAWGEECPIDRVEWLADDPSASLCAPEVQAAALLTWALANTDRRAVITACLPQEQVPELIARLLSPS
jgi:hypothetical protein